jgi:hypothetical protein
MNREKRGQVLRERFKELFPHAYRSNGRSKPKRAQYNNSEKTKGYTWAFFYRDGTSPMELPAQWVLTKEEREEEPLVAPLRRRKGKPVLTVIAEKMKRGTVLWPK